MTARRYVFGHRCHVAASPDLVREAVLDVEHYPRWWRQIRAVGKLGPDTALVVVRSVLPYDLEVVLDAVNRGPQRLEVRLSGAMEGHAAWTLAPGAGGTRLAYEQVVDVNGALAAASYAVKPLLAWNHSVMMRGFDRGIGGEVSDRAGRRPAPPA